MYKETEVTQYAYVKRVYTTNGKLVYERIIPRRGIKRPRRPIQIDPDELLKLLRDLREGRW